MTDEIDPTLGDSTDHRSALEGQASSSLCRNKLMSIYSFSKAHIWPAFTGISGVGPFCIWHGDILICTKTCKSTQTRATLPFQNPMLAPKSV